MDDSILECPIEGKAGTLEEFFSTPTSGSFGPVRYSGEQPFLSPTGCAEVIGNFKP